MNRDLGALSTRTFDLVIIGGGIFGACAAWDAAQRGLSVALLERGDFAHAASANCFKIAHGGIRYLQHGDLVRLRESSRERRALLRIAPHLVSPLPVVIPTYGHGRRGQELLRLGTTMYDALTWDRNAGLDDPQRRIPPVRSLSRERCLELFPGLRRDGLTGGVLFHDAQIFSPARLALAFLQSAADAGASVANYVEANGFVRQADRVAGVRATDRLSGRSLEVRGAVVLNAAGPWAERLLADRLALRLQRPLTFSRDAAFVIRGRVTNGYTLAVQASTMDPDAVLSRGGRHLFLAPWRDYTLIGVWHVVHRGHPDEVAITDQDLQRFLDEVNDAYPALGLTRRDVTSRLAGLTLFGDNSAGATRLRYGHRSVLIDHEQEHGVQGLISLVGVRYTTARGMAQRGVDLVFQKLGRRSPRCRTASTTIRGGHVGRTTDFERQAMQTRPIAISEASFLGLLRNHGAAYRSIMQHVQETPALAQTLDGSSVLRAEVVHAVREEMAQTLADVVFRRTDLGTGEHPGQAALRACADVMAAELGWDAARVQRELEEVGRVDPNSGAGKETHDLCSRPCA